MLEDCPIERMVAYVAALYSPANISPMFIQMPGACVA